MSVGEMVVIALGGILLVLAGWRFGANFFSPEARRERRRRRSNAPLASNSKRPMVKFSVHTKPPRRK
jgi:hypothetical protein